MKYKLTDETKEILGKTLHRIVCVTAFGNVAVGDFTYTMSNDKWKVGCFYGSGEELIAKAYKDSELSGDCYKAAVEFVEKIKAAKKKA